MGAANFTIELMTKGFDKLKELTKNLTLAEEKQKAFNKLVSGTTTDKIKDLTKTFQTFKEAGGITGMVKGTISSVGNLGKAFYALLPAIGSVGAALAATGIIVILLAVAATIAIVIVAWKMMKRAIDLNIGGIKGTFLKSMAKIKLAVAGLKIQFDKVLKTAAPGFKILGEYVSWAADNIVTGLVAGFKMMMPLMNMIVRRFNTFMKVGKILGPILVKGLKLLFSPLMWLIKGFAKIIEYIDKIENSYIGKLFGGDSQPTKADVGASSGGNQNNSTYNNNVAIHAQSNLSPENAPHFGNMLVGAIGNQQKVGM